VLFIVMRYIDGPDLRGLVRTEGKLDPERAAHIVAQIGSGLDAAHEHGLVHRDVKPANVLLGPEDHAYLTDFGLTKRAASTGGGVSRPGGWVGTLGYVAPEQIRGERVDARTDVYALGCVLVYALTGASPYVRESDEATLWAHLNDPPPRDAVPAEFEGVVTRALGKDPSDRYPSAGDLGRAALAAAGRSPSKPMPERNVARGAAAPMVEGQTAPTMLADLSEGETQLSPPDDAALATAPTARDDRRPPPPSSAAPAGIGAFVHRSRGALLAAGLLLVAVVVAVALATGGDPDTPGSTQTTAAPPPPSSPSALAERPIEVGARPNALTIAGGKVWVLTGATGSLLTRDAATGRRDDRFGTGQGGKSVADGFRSMWVLKGVPTRSLLRISQRTGARLDRTQISVPGDPVLVVTGAKHVWVAVRNVRLADHSPETVMKIMPGSLGQQPITVPGGVEYIAVGEGALWVAHRFRKTVLRVDLRSGARREINVRGLPQSIAIGEDAVWVATSGEDTITRINPRTGNARSIAVDYTPERVAVGGGSIWSTARQANQLIRIDPDTRSVVENIKTGSRPYALEVTKGTALWLTLLGEDSIQRVKFTK